MRTAAVLILAAVLPTLALAQAPAAPNPSAAIAEAAKQIDQALAGKDPAMGPVGEQVAQALNAAVTSPRDLNDADFATYCQTMIRAYMLAGNHGGAMGIADGWVSRGGETAEPRAMRAAVMVRMADSMARGVMVYMDMLKKPAYAAYKPWVEYMRPLAELAGRQLKDVAVPLEGNAVFKTETMGDSMAVLYFWAVAPGGEKAAAEDIARQNALVSKFGPAGASVIGINLDEGPAAAAAKKFAADQKALAAQFYQADNPQACPSPKPIPITAVPTAFVLGSQGQVMFAGDPRTPEASLVLAYGLVDAKRRETEMSQYRFGGEGGGRFGGERGMGSLAPLAAAPPDPNVAEAEAQKLYDDGLNQLLLGQRTRNSVMRQKGIDAMRKCADQYPNTKWAQQAKDKIQEYAQ